MLFGPKTTTLDRNRLDKFVFGLEPPQPSHRIVHKIWTWQPVQSSPSSTSTVFPLYLSRISFTQPGNRTLPPRHSLQLLSFTLLSQLHILQPHIPSYTLKPIHDAFHRPLRHLHSGPLRRCPSSPCRSSTQRCRNRSRPRRHLQQARSRRLHHLQYKTIIITKLSKVQG